MDPFCSRNHHPDHDSLATSRRRFLEELSDLFLLIGNATRTI